MKNYDKVQVRFCNPGHYHVVVTRANDCFVALTTDMETVDLFKSEERGWKAAGNHLYKNRSS